MNLRKPESVIATIQTYMGLDTAMFEEVCTFYLHHKKRKSFDLMTQNGLRTLIELHADTTTLAAFLLFHLPSEKRQKLVLDENVLHLLHGLDGLRDITSLHKVRMSQSSESVRKMFLAMSKDLRVVLILMAFRYAELFELDQLSPDLRRLIARQTLDIFVPITGRLGIYTLKRKLEDLCFSYLSESEYNTLLTAFDRRTELQDKTVEALVAKVQTFLSEHGIDAEVSGRVKGKYSTYMKLKRKGGGSLDEIYDLLALRVMVKDQAECYTVLSLINNNWNSITGRFKDYIAMPKVNGYRSLHATLLGMIPDSLRPVEVQIRTSEMHREAEYGIAAHWWYEEVGIKKGKTQEQFVGKNLFEDKLQWVKNLVQLQDSIHEEKTGKDSMSFFADRLFVMTLNGRVVELPQGATPLDFAYALSDSLGHHCSKAKVNGKLVPLDYELKNGDRVFVVKKMDVSPNLYWLSLVKTNRARKAIQSWLLEQGEDTVFDHGVRMLNQRLRRYQHEVLDKEYSLLKTYQGKKLSQSKVRALLISVGKGELDADDVVKSVLSAKHLKHQEKVAFSPLSKKRKSKGAVSIGGETGFPTKLAACCNPSLGDPILGYVTRGDFISVHHKSCKVLKSLDSNRCIEAWWSGHEESFQEVRIEVVVQVANLLEKLSKVMQDQHVGLKGFYHDKAPKGYALTFDLSVKNAGDLDYLLKAWQGVQGVLSVKTVGQKLEVA